MRRSSRRRVRPTAGPLLPLVAALALFGAASRADDKPAGLAPFWEDPAGLEPVAIPHLRMPPANFAAYLGENAAACGPGGLPNVGQTFVPRTARIWRMDFQVTSAYNGNVDPRPGIVRIYKWRAGGYRATVSAPPLFVQHVDLGSSVDSRIVLYPDLRFAPDERDDTYYVEFGIPGMEREPPRLSRHTYGVSSVRASVDAYPDGGVYAGCALQEGPRPEAAPGGQVGVFEDLWFEFHGVAERAAAPRALHPSDPSARWYAPLESASGDPRDQYWNRINELAQLVRTAALAPGSTQVHGHLLNETFLYLACQQHDRCPLWLDAEDLLANVQTLFRRTVVELAACREPGYGVCHLHFHQLMSPGLALLLLREAGALERFPRELQAGIRDLVFARGLDRSFPTVGRGTDANVLSSMLAYLMFHVLYPEAAPPAWIDYYQTVWRSLWELRETEVDSEGYQLLALYHLLVVARFAPQAPDAARWYRDVWSDPHWRKLVDRYQQLVTPIGSFPNFGDGSGVSLVVPSLIWLFEEAAARFGEPGYRETARRLFEYNARYARMRSRAAGGFWEPFDVGPTFHGLAMAYLTAGEARVPEQPASPGSLYTLRRKAARLGDPLPPAPAYTFSRSADPVADVPPALIASVPGAQTANYVPDKLILRSGSGRDGLSFVFNLLSGYQHGHPELGALASFTDDGSILMMNVPFSSHLYRHRAEDESGPVMRHYRGGLIDFSKRATGVEITRFTEAAAATVAGIAFGDLQGWQVRQRRHFLFAKDRFLLVRDGFEAGPTQPGGIEVAVGPVWHAADVRPERDTDAGASDWYDVYHRQPVGSTTRFRNPERYSLLYFVGRPGHTTAAYKEGAYMTLADSARSPGSLTEHPACRDPQDPLTPVRAAAPDCRTTPPYVLYQKWTGTLQTGDSRWFDTLLLPHARTAPATVAAGVRELAVGDDYTALQVETGGETWIVVDNPGRRSVSAERLAGALATQEPYLTNAEFLMLRFQPGRPTYVVVAQADFIHTGAYASEFSPPRTGEFEAPARGPETRAR